MSLPGANYKPAAGDTIKNGVYQDFASYIRNYPTRWGNVRASRTNNLDMGIYKNFVIRERLKIQFRFETYNTFNHAALRRAEQRPHQFQLRCGRRLAAERSAHRPDGAEGFVLTSRAVFEMPPGPSATRGRPFPLEPSCFLYVATPTPCAERQFYTLNRYFLLDSTAGNC